MNILYVKAYESYRLTDIHAYMHTLRTYRQDRNYKPQRCAGDQLFCLANRTTRIQNCNKGTLFINTHGNALLTGPPHSSLAPFIISVSSMHCEARQWSAAAWSRYFGNDWSSLATCWSVHPVQPVSAGTPYSRSESTSMLSISFNLSPSCRHVMQLCGRQSTNNLFVPRTRLLLGERAFRIAAPKAWNQLPHNVRCVHNTNTFKKKLKTFFTMFYFC